MKFRLLTVVIILVLGTAAMAQQGPGPMDGGAGMPGPIMITRGPGGGGPGAGGYGMGGHGMGGYGMHGTDGAWWRSPAMVQRLGLSDAQVQQLDKLSLDSRMRLIDQRAALEKEELTLRSLMQAEQPDEAQINAQIDHLAEARANLEKSHVQWMLGMRHVLTPAQWKQLHSQRMGPRPGMGGQRGWPAGRRGQAPKGPAGQAPGAQAPAGSGT